MAAIKSALDPWRHVGPRCPEFAYGAEVVQENIFVFRRFSEVILRGFRKLVICTGAQAKPPGAELHWVGPLGLLLLSSCQEPCKNRRGP